jgi:hypothetical protein
LVIRNKKGSAEAFNFFGEKALLPTLEIIDSRNTKTASVFIATERIVHLYVSEDSLTQVIDLIRDLIIKTEEHRGTLILHAAGAVYKGHALALVGSKGAGKSTFLLDLVGRRGMGFLSGDKLFLRMEENRILAYGWPDYPHLGYGTILGHPRLVDAVRALGHQVDSATPGKKILLPPASLQAALQFDYLKGPVPLRHLVLPQVATTAASTSRLLLDTSDPTAILKHLEFSSEDAFMGWHSFIRSAPRLKLEPTVDQFADLLFTQCRFYRLEGSTPLVEADLEVFD